MAQISFMKPTDRDPVEVQNLACLSQASAQIWTVEGSGRSLEPVSVPKQKTQKKIERTRLSNRQTIRDRSTEV
jgi:hypothetical protein